jgi:hypothetical protein
MDHVHSLHDLDLVRRGIRAAALLDASGEFTSPKTTDERKVLALGFDIFNDACLTALGVLAGLPSRDQPSDWDAIVSGALAAVDGPLTRLTGPIMSTREIVGYTVAYAYVVDALGEAALGVTASALGTR